MFTTSFPGTGFPWESQLISVESQVSRKIGKGEGVARPNQAKILAEAPAKEIPQSACPFCDLPVPSWQ